jgi:hypothetical protein
VVWQYEQITGRILQDGERIAVGYSGAGECKNVPAAQDVHNAGPIPRGTYTIGAPVNTVTHGPYVLPLTPDAANEMCGRAGFLIHGDSVVHPGTASEGCIILGRQVREAIWNSKDTTLEVI